jgi:hypothetical protein
MQEAARRRMAGPELGGRISTANITPLLFSNGVELKPGNIGP